MLLLFLQVSCSSHTPEANAGSSKARLVLEAGPRQGFGPLHVTFHAVLEGVEEHDQDFYCLQEEWDFGDGAKSSEQPYCEDYTPESTVRTEFFVEHDYEEAGIYSARFTLGDKKIFSRQVNIKVIERSS